MSAVLSMDEALFGRSIGAGAAQQSLSPGRNATVKAASAVAGSLLYVALPVNVSFGPILANPIVSISGGVSRTLSVPSSVVPEFELDGSPGQIVISWQDMGWYQAGVNTYGPVSVTVQIPGKPTCPAGQYWDGSSCRSCPAGTTWDGSKCAATAPPPKKPPPGITAAQRAALLAAAEAAQLAAAAQRAVAATNQAHAASATNTAIQAGLIATQSFQATATAAGAPGLSSLVGGVSSGAAVFPLTQGQRISLQIKSNSGALPGAFGSPSAPLSVAALQAQLDAAGVAATVVSVKYSADGTTLFLEEDHCGPTTSTSNPFVAPDGSVTTTYQSMGAGQCGAVVPAGWSTTKKVVVLGGGAVVLAAVVAAGTKAAGLW